jgi:hypothetical protein
VEAVAVDLDHDAFTAPEEVHEALGESEGGPIR